MAKFKSIKNQFEKGIRSVFLCKTLGMNVDRSQKYLKKNSKTHGRYVGEFQPQKRDSYYIKIFLKKNLRFLLEQDIVGKIILASFSLNVTLQ